MRGSIPAPEADKMVAGGNTPCIALHYEDEPPVIIDAGSGLRLFGESLALQQGDSFTATLLLSHFHWDHIQGFPFFGPVYSPKTHLSVVSGFLPATVRKNLSREMTEPFFPRTLRSLPATIEYLRPRGGTMDVGSLQIRTVPLNHPGGAIGFSIRSPAGSVIYVSDHEHGVQAMDEHIQLVAQGADLMVYDSHFTPEEYPAFAGWGHSTWLAGAEIAKRAGVGRLLLFHHSPTRTDSELNHLLERARGHFAQTDLASEHGEIVLSVPAKS